MIDISTRAIEEQIANYELHFDSMKDDEIEWRYQPPAFVVAFIDYLEKFQRIPAQDEFAEHYVALNRAALNDEFLRKWKPAERASKKRALIARLKRAYPSFVRDVYFLALLRENGIAVDYDAAHDVEAGVDLIVAHRLQIHVFLDSPRSKQGRAKKNRRHTFAGEHHDVILKPSECKRVGEFWLPTIKHVEQIKRALG
jgi:hypothetical protein